MSNSKKKQKKSGSISNLSKAQINEIIRRFNDNEKLLDVARAMGISFHTARYRFEMLAKEREVRRDKVFNTILRRATPKLNSTQH